MRLTDLVVTLLVFNMLTFGNGPVMIPLLQARLVDGLGVLSQEQLLYAFAIARATPGPANVYVAAIGFFLFGIVGAVLSTAAIQLPGYLMLPLVRGYERLRAFRSVRGFIIGLTATSVGLIFAATVEIAVRSLTNPIGWIVFALTLALTYLLKWNPILSLIAASVLGILLSMLA